MQALDEPVSERVLPALEQHRGDIDELSEFDGNPRQHDLPAIAEVYREFGQVQPLLVNLGEQTGRGRELIAGHGQLAVMRRHGWTRPAWIEGDWTDREARRLLVAMNGSSRNAVIDADALAEFLLPTIDDLTGSTYDVEELQEALARRDADMDADRPDPPGIDDDERDHDDDEDGEGSTELVLEPEPDPVTRRGDVWTLGPHRLMCGDCTVRDDLEVLDLDGIDLLIADPPYCSGGHQETARKQTSVGVRTTHKQIANDTLSTRGYIALVKSALSLPPVPYAFVFTDWRMWGYLYDLMESSGYGVRSMIVWKKPNPGMGRGWRSQHELIAWGCNQTPPWDQRATGMGNVLEHPRTGNDLHTTQKPESLVGDLLRNVAEFTHGVYDPFGGSSTTLMAAHELNLPARVMELDPGYADTSLNRALERGLDGVRESDGARWSDLRGGGDA